MSRSIDKIKMCYYEGLSTGVCFPYYPPDDVVKLVNSLDERITELENKVQVLLTENNSLENKLRQAESTLVQWSNEGIYIARIKELEDKIRSNVNG